MDGADKKRGNGRTRSPLTERAARDTAPAAGPDLSSLLDKTAADYGRPGLPAAGYAGLMAVYSGLFGGLLYAASRRRREPEFATGPWDLLLLGTAAFKLSRLISKDWITSPFRAPVSRNRGASGPAEAKDEPRGEGLQRALGELITCPWCMGQWTATVLAYGLVLAPRQTRLVNGVLTSAAVSDFLNYAYTAVEKRA